MNKQATKQKELKDSPRNNQVHPRAFDLSVTVDAKLLLEFIKSHAICALRHLLGLKAGVFAVTQHL